MNADPYTRAFAAAFSTQDADSLARLMSEDAEVVTATGQHCEGREAARLAFAEEFGGTFRAARLVSGRSRLRPVGPGAALLSQRYVLSGAVGPDGADLPRCALLLSALVVMRPEGWQALSCHITALA